MRVKFQRGDGDTIVRVVLDPPSDSLSELLYDVVLETGGMLELSGRGEGLLRLPDIGGAGVLESIEGALWAASVTVEGLR